MPVTAVKVVSIPVSDPERARRFYVETLGFELLRDDSSIPDMRWVQVAPPGSDVSLTLVTWFESMPPGCVEGLVLGSSDLDADYASFSARGATFDGPPQTRPWGREAVLRDPDGNGLVLQQSP
jgi:catechol 2,3-dioxygenase-like lactoylglutathione lyase family enzyme